MRKFVFVFISCMLICVGAYRFCDFKLSDGAWEMKKNLYQEIYVFFVPEIALGETSAKQLAYMELEQMLFPALSDSRKEQSHSFTTNDSSVNETESTQNGQESISSETTEKGTESTEKETMTSEATTEAIAQTPITDTRKVIVNREKLKDFDFLRLNFFQVDNTTTVDSTLLDVNKFLNTDVSLSDNTQGPQVLIYHTHSQEGYADSTEGDASTSVVAIGDYLEKLLNEKGIRTIHHKGEYDVNDRDHAYSNALPSIEQVLRDNPTVEVVIDLHRDGVPETLHLVTEVEGRPTAQIMFFNGLSKTTSQGELAYLANPYIDNNLALSFQLQLAAEEYYPGWARKIYLKGYRYNQHICSKCLLVEVGAQTNSFEEAKNAMIPLADILDKVLK